MGTWFIGAKEDDSVYMARDMMMAEPIEADDKGKDASIAFLKKRGTWSDEIVDVVQSDYILIDGGGMVGLREPKVGWTANSANLKTYVRQLPFVIELFEKRQLNTDLPGCIQFDGMCRHYVLADETRKESLEVMRRLLKGTESLRQEWELAIHKDVIYAGAVSLRKCGCLSGLQYVECCGKFVTS